MAISKIDMERCIGCGMCENYCPVDVIRFNQETKRPVIAYEKDCMICQLCAKQCPVQAIEVTKEKKHDTFLAWG